MSGTSRLPSLGTPGPVCQLGFANSVLTPPPLAASEPSVLAISAAVTFQAISGMYDRAEPLAELLVEFQKLPEPSLNVVPPAPVTYGSEAVTSTASPWLADFTVALGLVG